MNTSSRILRIRPHWLALAAATALGLGSTSSVRAEEGVDGAVLTVGLGVTDGDRAQFGQYNGLRTDRPVLRLGGELFRLDADEARSLHLQASDLLGDLREISLVWRQLADWRLAASFSQGIRRDPYTLRTGLQGVGSAVLQGQVVSPGAGTEVNMELKRTALGLSLRKALSARWELGLDLKTEDKKGTRLFGIGMTCPSLVAPDCRGPSADHAGSAVLLAPEPVDANHTQWELRANYGAENLSLSLGAQGSIYRNRWDRLTLSPADSAYNGVGALLPLRADLLAMLSAPVALAPDNQAHQFDVSGVYRLSPTASLRMKIAQGQASQQQDFAAAGFAGAPAGVSNLAGKVETTLAQLGFSARPLSRLSVQGDLRWEDRDDQTPLALYNQVGGAAYTNGQQPNTKLRAKLLLGWQFEPLLRGSLGVERDFIDRGVFTATSAVSGISALRQKTDETILRAELRRTMNESFSGAVTVETSRRGGSNWLRDASGLGVVEVADPMAAGSGLGASAIYMPTLADRERDKIKLRGDWQPSDELSLQFSAATGRDGYTTPGTQGLRHADMGQLALDAEYALSERWRLQGQFAWDSQLIRMSRPEAAQLSLRNTGTSLGLGVTGKPVSKMEIGANLLHSEDRNRIAQTVDGSMSADNVALLAATGGLPDIVFRQTSLKVFGSYEVSKQSSFRLDLMHLRSYTSDWAWGWNGTAFAFGDGSTVWQKPTQNATLLMLTYTQRWP